MRHLCLSVARFCLCFWAGAATFFVFLVTDLRRSELFTESTKLNHPRVLFPLFYRFEFILLTIALVCGIVGILGRGGRSRTYLASLLCIAGALLLAGGDYLWVYGPLQEMLPMETRPANFQTYHWASMTVNAAGLLLSLTGAWLIVWFRPAPSKN